MSIGIGLPLHIVSSPGSSKGLQPCDTHKTGGMAERTKASVLKTDRPGDGSRGFESHSLRRGCLYTQVDP